MTASLFSGVRRSYSCSMDNTFVSMACPPLLGGETMNYTGEQLKLLATFENGRLVQELTEQELYVYRFLMEQGLLQPRADIEDGWHLLSEKGKTVLECRQTKLQMLQKIADKDAEKKRNQRLHNNLEIVNTILPVVTFILGLLVDHFANIVDGIIFLWELIFH